MKYLVTVKRPKNPNHDPHNKVTGKCPVTQGICTDVTGEHHSFLYESENPIEQVREFWEQFFHVTRIEVV